MGVVDLGPRSTAGLEIVDITDPLHPTHVGGIDGFDPKSVIARGTYAMLSDGFGTYTIDISNPSTPLLVNPTLPTTGRMAQSGFHAYFSNSRIYDLSAKPAEVGLIRPPTGLQIPEPYVGIVDIAASGNRLYVEGQDCGIYVYDLQDRIAPAFLGRFIHRFWPRSLSASENFLVIRDGYNGMHLFDISNPIQPKHRSQYSNFGYGAAVTFGSRAYISGSSGLEILNITDPAKPIRLAILPMFDMAGLLAHGNYVYNSYGDIIDVSNPVSPQKTGTFNNGTLVRMKVLGNRFYSLAESGVFRIHDLNQPSILPLLGSYSLNSYPLDFAVSESFAFFPWVHTDTLSISAPSNITLFNSQPDADIASTIDASGSKLYRSRGPELTLEDATNPGGTLPATIDVGMFVIGIVAVGDYAYVLAQQGDHLTSLKVYQGTIGAFLNEPRLFSSRGNGKVIVQWPTSFPGLKLYSSTSLSESWQLVTDPVYQKGSLLVVTNSSPGGTMLFYKLSP